MKHANFLVDTRIVHRRVLQTITQSLVIQQNFCARRYQRSRSQVPVVYPIALLHASSSHHSVDCNRNAGSTKTTNPKSGMSLGTRRAGLANQYEKLLHAQPKPCTNPAAVRSVQTWTCPSTHTVDQYPEATAGPGRHPVTCLPFCPPCSAKTIDPAP